MIGKTKDCVWFYSVRYKDISGKTHQKYQQDRTWQKKDAKREADKFLATVETIATKITLNALYELYIDDLAKRAKASSLYNIQLIYKNHIGDPFGRQIAANITPRQIYLWQTELTTKYKVGTVKTVHSVFSSIIQFGIDHEMLTKSPLKAKLYSDTKTEMDYWTPEEFAQFIDHIDKPLYALFFRVLYWTGMRKGEALALTVSDVDFKANAIVVSKTYDYQNGLITSPKTINSYRRIQMTQELRNDLQTHIDGLLAIDGTDETANLFYLDHHLSPNTVERIKNITCKLAGVKQIRIHDFRHSHVSLLVNMGFSSFEIAKRLGHTPSMVENVYSHLFDKTQKEMVNRLDEVAISVKPTEAPTKRN